MTLSGSRMRRPAARVLGCCHRILKRHSSGRFRIHTGVNASGIAPEVNTRVSEKIPCPHERGSGGRQVSHGARVFWAPSGSGRPIRSLSAPSTPGSEARSRRASPSETDSQGVAYRLCEDPLRTNECCGIRGLTAKEFHNRRGVAHAHRCPNNL